MKRRTLGLLSLLLCLVFLLPSCMSGDKSESAGSQPAESTTALQPTEPPSTTLTPTSSAVTTAVATTAVSSRNVTTGTSVSSTSGTTAKSISQHAEEILKTMTLSEKVGQMFIVRCPETDAAASVSRYRFGGYILFSRDFQGRTPDKVRAAIRSYQSASNVKMLIGVDEEGGSVNRVSMYSQFRSTPFSSPQTLYGEGGWSRIVSDTLEKAKLLKSLGINLNLAPVCDVSTDPNDYIYARSFGKSAALTADYAGKVVTAMNSAGIGCTLKHFPGYGNNANTHTGISYDSRSYSSFQTSDFLSFKAGIRAGAGSVLVSHNIVKCMDADRPASLSPKVHQILRNELGFTGVIMTDDLSMDAIKLYTSGAEAAVSAVLSGNDLLCCTDFATQVPAVMNAVKSGQITQARLDESVLRILKWKLELGVIQ